VAELHEEPYKVFLVKPETFMNLSGRCVRQVLDYYQVPVEDLLVICDDINLPLGKLRCRARGSHGGHKGLRDIEGHLGTNAYARLRLGVGAPPEDDAIDHVLGRFRPIERPLIEEAIQTAAQAVGVWIQRGIAAAMNQYNAGSEPRPNKPRPADRPQDEGSTQPPSE
jgi:PTH1 family peptidyl-tRNA hydrolase